MMNTINIGRHVTGYLPPDVIFIAYRGDVSREEAVRLSEWYSATGDGKDMRYLVDLRELGTIPPAARKEMAAQRRPQKADRDYTLDLGFVGATLRTKVLMTVVLAAASLASNVKMRTHYFTDLDAAAAWANLDRALLG